MIIRETTVFRLFDGDLRKLLPMRKRDTIKSIDVQTDTAGQPVRVDVVVEKPSRGRWFKKIETYR